jgi:Domain of unknown function (DUF4124)
MRTAFIFLMLLASPALAGQIVWKYVDAQGVTHYTDQPVPGAQKIELRSGNISTSRPSAEETAGSTASSSEQSFQGYRNFEIWKPSDQETIVNTGGLVQINMRLEPSLQTGHTVFLYLDGKLIDGFPGNTLNFELGEISRGTHTAVGVIQDENDRRLKETNKVSFTVRQKSIAAQPPVGPSVRPPPKPPVQPQTRAMGRSQRSYADLKGQRQPMDPATNAPAL